MTWKVPFIDYPAQFRKMEGEIIATVTTTLAKGDVMLRQQLFDFEANLAAFVGTRHAIGVSNCTDALHLTLRAAGIGPGSEVITVAHTFVATAAAIHHAGATPVLMDIGDDHNMDVGLLDAAITPQTRAIIPVHLNGRICAMDTVMETARRHRLVVIEDAAQALGATFKGRGAGAFGLAGCFSFYPAKLLGAYGDAGAVVTDDENLAQTLRLLRNHGRTLDGDIAGWSFNCRMDNLHAAILDLKLKKLRDWITRRREIAALYQNELAGVRQITLPPPPGAGVHFDSFQNYEIEAEARDALAGALKAQGVETLVPWGGKAVHEFKALGLTHFRLPRTERLMRRALMLPMHTELDDDQVRYVAGAVKAFYVG